MTGGAMKVDNVGKCYPTYGSEFTRIARWFGAPLRPKAEFWAVRGVSFEMAPGEAIAIIGQNGAGKSTLLKLITGTVRPTTGAIAINGRVSAILELGLGFNAEFTGRENVRHSGGLLGLSPAEIERLMPEIEAFAEIGVFFDQPLRVYSSGMQARLAFALATAIRPEVLIVDEVLSVGDSYFQHKSFARIREFKEQGSSILLVTHSMGDVRELCERVILLDCGAVVKDGAPDEVVDYYNAMIAEKENAKLTIEQRRDKNGWLSSEYGDRAVEMKSVSLHRALDGEEVAVARVGEALEVRMAAIIKEPVEQLVIGHRISDRTGHTVWGSNTFHTRQALKAPAVGSLVRSRLKFDCNLGPGSYAITFGLHRDDTHISQCYQRIENSVIFDVVNVGEPFFIGTANLGATFELAVER
ncbi:MAG: ABC transporter ATP-binding protein [Parvularculaceae bacterium]|nr:ABC transporter ATP-binding protein [Parvularculaceae bacterium]